METLKLRSQPLWALLQLIRPANIVTAWADILVGYAAATGIGVLSLTSSTPDPTQITSLAWLLIATSGLYGGGIVFNDVFDYKLDQEERPERPLPSGQVSPLQAAILGSGLLIGGVLSALQVSIVSAGVAAFVAIAALLYDGIGKHQTWVGPINMGLCRGGNLLLGVSVIPWMLRERWMLALIPIVYIAAITAISRGEVDGGNKRTGKLAIALVIAVIASVANLTWLEQFDGLSMLPFLLGFGGWVLPPFWRAMHDPIPSNIGQAVKAGVLGLILLDAAIAAGFAGWINGLLILGLLPLSVGLARLFSVT